MTAGGQRLSSLFTWRSAIAASPLPPTSKLVAFGLSLYMSERGDSAYPSNATLSADTSLSERAVREHLGLLVEGGWLTRDDRTARGGRGQTVHYTAVIPAPAAPIENPAPERAKGGTSRHERGHLSALKGAGGAPEYAKRATEDSAITTPTALAMDTADPFDDFWAAYPHHGRGKAEARKAWARAIRRAPAETIIAAAARLAADPNLPEARFVPHAATWLNNDRWEDGPLPARGGVTPIRHNPMDRREAGVRRLQG